MKIHIIRLDLVWKKDTDSIEFPQFSYFYGEVGSGKSTVARLIDYCLGGKLVETPALQNEFVSCTLNLAVNGTPVALSRDRNSNQIEATWGEAGEEEHVVVPARDARGVVIPGTKVEVVSDLFYHVAGFDPPKVRKSQAKESSGLERLSLRDLLWYCYLDQDTIDSTFYNLDRNADTFKRLKSRNVLRYILGVHQERVAELESELEEARRERLRREEAAKVLAETLQEVGLSSGEEIEAAIQELKRKGKAVRGSVKETRGRLGSMRGHVSDQLRTKARDLSGEIEALEDALGQIEETIAEHTRHRNEMLGLSTKIQRVSAARAVLNNVQFEHCPRCQQTLPAHAANSCLVCGLGEPDYEAAQDEIATTREDVRARQNELDEMIRVEGLQRKNLARRKRALLDKKAQVDRELVEALEEYDSAYLAEALSIERERADVTQEIKYLERSRSLPAKVDSLQKRAELIEVQERSIRKELRQARDAAEQDTTNVKRLGELFLDCLLRAKIAGFGVDDMVKIRSPHFLPEVVSPESGELATVSFETLGSGGKKTLFKCCFALAMHRLAQEIGATLPTLLVIDSPMKNISERENRSQFEGFHHLLYELAEGELSTTQFVLIDKEHCPPAATDGLEIASRHMTVDKDDAPPLIRYYRGP